MTGDYCTGSADFSPLTAIDSDGTPTFGTAVAGVDVRFQLRTFTITDTQGKSILIEAVLYTDNTTVGALGDRVTVDSENFRVASRRVYSDLDGPVYQKFLLERMKP